MKKDSFDKFIDTMDLFANKNPLLFDILGHVVLALCVILTVISFLYAIS